MNSIKSIKNYYYFVINKIIIVIFTYLGKFITFTKLHFAIFFTFMFQKQE